MLRITLLENKRTFLVPLFFDFCVLGSEVSWFSVSKFLGFKVSKICRISFSCLQEEIVPASKIFKISLYGSPGFFGALFSKNVNKLEFQLFEIYKHNISQKGSRLFLIF